MRPAVVVPRPVGLLVADQVLGDRRRARRGGPRRRGSRAPGRRRRPRRCRARPAARAVRPARRTACGASRGRPATAGSVGRDLGLEHRQRDQRRLADLTVADPARAGTARPEARPGRYRARRPRPTGTSSPARASTTTTRSTGSASMTCRAPPARRLETRHESHINSIPARPRKGNRARRPLGRRARLHFRSGRTSILRKKISAPSDWNWIFPSVRLDFGADVDDVAVDDVGDRVAVADHLHPVPLAGRLLDVVLAAEAEHVLPGRVAAPPVVTGRSRG